MEFQTPLGMHDLFEEDLFYYEKIKKVFQNLANFYGFSQIETPIFEKTDLFKKGTGMFTDIVEKEMYSFETKGGDSLTLRPEGTPPVIRAFLQHGFKSVPKPVKFWYFGPFFRHERPQAGRYRQFYQIGFEIIGINHPVLDAQIVQIFYQGLKELGLENLICEVNSVGDQNCRPVYKRILENYFKKHQDRLCPDCKRRLTKNPLRILDCKEEQCRKIIEKAPQFFDYLCDSCKEHFKTFLEFLDEAEIPYDLNPYLVRGLDYYTKTVFEIKTEDSNNSLAGGGRYDNLIKFLGGDDTPATGGALGVERIKEIIQKKQKIKEFKKRPDIFLAQVGQISKRKSFKLLEDFRKAGIYVAEALYKDSLSAQLKIADKLLVKYVLILGQEEVNKNKIIIRDMKSGDQKIVSLEKIINEIKSKLTNKK